MYCSSNLCIRMTAVAAASAAVGYEMETIAAAAIGEQL